MALFPVNEIHTLLFTAASKAGVEQFDKRGFEILAKKIQEEIPRSEYGVLLSYRYLRESIYDSLMDSIQKGEDEIGFNPDYIDTLCQFAGYKSFNTFHEHFEKWQKELEALISEPARIAILFSPEEQKDAEEIRNIAELNKLECTMQVLQNKGEEVETLPHEVLFAIIVLGESLQLRSTLERTSKWVENISSPVFFFLSNPLIKDRLPPDWNSRPFLKPRDRHLFFSMIQMHTKKLLGKSFKAKEGGVSMHIQAQNIGTIFVGHNHIHTRFSAVEDIPLGKEGTSDH